MVIKYYFGVRQIYDVWAPVNASFSAPDTDWQGTALIEKNQGQKCPADGTCASQNGGLTSPYIPTRRTSRILICLLK